jgi:geranylgeranyl reductase family protein
MKVDVLVIGLGPAGGSLIHELAKLDNKELKILAIDKRERPGYPVQCGEFMPSPEEMVGLMPDVPNAEEFFTFDSKYISTRTNRITFFSPSGKMIQTPFEGYTLHRGKWNEDLILSAEKSGVEVWRSSKAVKKENDSIFVSKLNSSPEPIQAKVIVGADGVRSRIARWSGLAERRSSEHFVYVKQHVMSNIRADEYDASNILMYFGEKYAPGAYAWIIPKNELSANVGVGLRTPMRKEGITVSKSLDNLVSLHPDASKILKDAIIESTIGGLVPVGLPVRKTVEEHSKTLILGDAASQIVSSVGGGIPTAMVAGSIAAHTINNHLSQNHPLMNYELDWRKFMMSMFIRSYKLRRLFDKISSGSDSRIQWYLNRLKSSDVDKVVHCRVPIKVTLAFPFIEYLNYLVK